MWSYAADFWGEDTDGISELFVGKPLGRPSTITPDQQAQVKDLLQNGVSISAIARQFDTSRQTIMRVRNQA